MEQDMEPFSKPKICNRMRLWEFPDKYVIEPTDGTCNQLVSLNCNTGAIDIVGEMPTNCVDEAPKTQSIFGVAGMIKFLKRVHVLVITARECVGVYQGHPIFKITKMRFLSCRSSLEAQSPQEKKIESELTKLLGAAENTHGLYLSYHVDLTLNAQRSYNTESKGRSIPIWEQADPRYLWNRSMTEELIQCKLNPFVPPIIQGSFQTAKSVIGKTTLSITLIARRCLRRAGTRMWRRGADLEGNVANFVETEQILEANGHLASYVQIRGSIPLLWEQVVDLTYKPSFKLLSMEDAPLTVKKHFADLKERYGSILAVDLINQRGGEGVLSQAFASTMRNIVDDDIKYVQFDFHKICGHVNFERLSILYKQIEDEIKQNSFFLLSPTSEKIVEQKGVIRTNCIDCLDRTNVTQSMFGRKAIETQLQRIGLFEQEETINQHPDVDKLFKILWANHGDDISIQYSGTPALKRDFVRYGQRTIQGVLGDGQSALARYYYNNFCDGNRQDAIDLLLGNYNTSRNRDLTSELQSRGVETFASLPLAVSLVLGCIMLAAMSLQGGKNIWRLLSSAFWTSLTLGIMYFVRINRRLFCNRPRLHKLF